MRARRTPFRLTDREVAHLDQLAASFGGRRRHGGVQKAIADYQRLGEDLAKGYWGNATDYVQDLEAREYLERALVALDGSLQERLARVVQDLDVAFVEVTRDDPGDRLREFHRHDGSWWWRRVPTKPGSLQKDLLR
jgi:hypothetical protein